MARCAEATSVTAISSGQPKYCWVACARDGPMNSTSSPSFSARCAIPASMDRYRCPTVAKSWPRGTISPTCTRGTATGAAFANAAIPAASSRSMPSGRSRNMKWRSASSPNGTSARCTPAG